MATAYTPTAGTDPIWDAWVVQMQAREQSLANDRSYVQRQIESNANNNLDDLGRNAEKGRANISVGLRSRGITRSSVAADKLAGYEGDVANQQQTIRRQADEARLSGDRNYATAITDLYASREGQIGQSQSRLRDYEDRQRQQTAELTRQEQEQKRIAEEQQKATLPPGIDWGALARAGQPAQPDPAVAQAQADVAAGKDLGWRFGESEEEKARKAIASGQDLGWRF